MPLHSAAAELRSAIDVLIIDAQVLIVRAQHEQMKAHVRRAQQTLMEALTLLDHYAQSAAPALSLGVVEAAVKSAKLRLELVEAALRTNGPDASDLS